MKELLLVEIVGAPVACAEGYQVSWRGVAELAGRSLQERFGVAVRVVDHDLFEAHCPALPPDAKIPVVMVDGELTSNGEKVSIPAIRR